MLPTVLRFTSIAFFGFCGLIVCGAARAQSFQCTPSATNLTNHAEGLAEPSGDIMITCTGGTPGTTINPNLILVYSAPVTNRLNGSGGVDATVTVDTGSGAVPANVAPVLQGANGVALNGLQIALPAGGNGSATIHVSNIRLNMNYSGAGKPVTALFSGQLPLTSATALVATAQTGLLAYQASTSITCTGSPLPATANWTNLFAAGTSYVSTRVTEGFANSFVAKDAYSDAGTRILLSYANFPSGATVLIPDYVAGSTSNMPTAAGDLNGIRSQGVYTPGALTLARVMGADATGAGGAPLSTKDTLVGNGGIAGSVSQVPLVNGAGTAVYEVIDSNTGINESAQFPTFVGLTATANQTAMVATEKVSLGPSSGITVAATPNPPVPRFATPPPPSDCAAVGDCGASYFPVLSATTSGLQFTVGAAGNQLIQYILVNNTGGGLMQFTTSVAYQGTASGWLAVTNQSGSTNHTTLQVTANPLGLAQGTYTATVTVNAGAAGSQNFTATLTVGPPQITISSVVNAASFQAGPLVAGSLATIKGTNFSGKAVGVTMAGLAATVLFSNGTQINVQVPAALASSNSAAVVVTVDGNSSAPAQVPLAAVSPGIFGVLNQDSTINSATNPAAAGTIVQIFATGLISPVSNGAIVAGFGNEGVPVLYSGSFPNGLQQVNAQLGTDAATLSSNQLVVCGTGAAGQLVCSPPFGLNVR